MEIRILLNNTVYLLITRIIKFFAGFIKTKLVAIYLGTYGTGIIAQINQLTELMARFTVSGMSDGLVKEIAESDKSDEAFREKLAVAIKTYICIIVLFIIAVLVLALVFKNRLTVYFFGGDKYTAYFFVGVITFPILVVNGVSFALLRSFKQIKYIARSELIGLLINLLIFIPLIFIWGLPGAAAYITLGYITILFINQHYANAVVLCPVRVTLADILKARINGKVIHELFLFAGFGMTAGIALILSDSITRAAVVSHLGIQNIGLYSPVIIWTSLFVGLILPSISTYLYPRYCECKSHGELITVMNDSLRFVTILMVPFILISVPLRYKIIPLFYSAQFRIAGDYLPWHLLGTLFYIWMFVFDQAMKPTGRIRTGGALIILMCLIDVCVVYLFIPSLGLYAFMLKFIVSPIVIFILYLFYWKNAIQFKTESKNVLMMAYTVAAFVLLMVIEKNVTQDYKIDTLCGICLSAFSFFLLSKSEKKLLRQEIKKLYSNKLRVRGKLSVSSGVNTVSKQ